MRRPSTVYSYHESISLKECILYGLMGAGVCFAVVAVVFVGVWMYMEVGQWKE